MLPLQSAKKRIKHIQQELGFFMHYVFFILGPAAELVVVAVIMVVVVMLFLVVSIWKKFSVDSSG